MSIAAIITAGGIGRRMGATIPKQFLPLAGVPVIVHTIRAFEQVAAITDIILVLPAPHRQHAEALLTEHGLQASCRIVTGGRLRQDSVRAGLQAAAAASYLVVHDGVRPLVTPDIIAESITVAQKYGAAIAAVPVKDTLKAVRDNRISKTIDRTGLWQAQTPQTVKRSLLEAAYAAADRDQFEGTDEAALLEHAGIAVTVVEGSEKNLKITRPEDLLVAEALIMEDKLNKAGQLRIGHGYDAHRLINDRPLVLGGVTIPYNKGLLGHSDADALTHALCDALLGAAGAGDIGRHFPDSDIRYKGIASIKLLEQVTAILVGKNLRLSNADITVVAQKPKLAPYLQEMRIHLAAACAVDESAINIKATTTEKMGFTGREEGIACHAVVILSSG